MSGMEAIKRALGLVKTPTQLVDRMHFEFRVMDGEETTDKQRKVDRTMLVLIVEILTRFTQMKDYLLGTV